MRYFKNLLYDLRSGRLALHPILLAATFCVVKISWPYLIGPTGDDGSGGMIFGNFIFWDFAACACFIALGAATKTGKAVAAKTATMKARYNPVSYVI